MCSINEVIGRINIIINARAFAQATPSISLLRVTPNTDPALGRTLVPWYELGALPVVHQQGRVDQNRFPQVLLRLPEQGDQPLTIQQIANGHDHPWLDNARIRHPTITTGVFPAYRVRESILLLDGNHRCISLVRFNANYVVDLIVLEGPIDRQVMADLAVFEA